MNSISLSGFVKNVKHSEKTGATAFTLAVAKGKDKSGSNKGYLYIRVKVFDGLNLTDGDRITVFGKLDSFEWNEKTCYEVLTNSYDIGVIESSEQRQNRPAREKTYAETAAERPRRSNPSYNDGMNGPEDFDEDIEF